MKGKKSKGKINVKKLTATLLIAVFILTTLAIAIPVSANGLIVKLVTPETGTHSDIELYTVGAGTAEWTSNGIELYVENGGTDWAEISIPIDIAIEDIKELKILEYIKTYSTSGYQANINLGIDIDGDGFEADVAAWHLTNPKDPNTLGDDTFVTLEMMGYDMTPDTGSWVQRDMLGPYNVWFPNAAKTGSIDWPSSLAELVTELTTSTGKDVGGISLGDKVKVIQIVLGGAPSWMEQTAYYSSLTYSASPGIIIDLLPSGNVGDEITVSGTGATEFSKVDIYWDDYDTKISETTADALKDYTDEINIPEDVAGTHYVIVKDRVSGDTAFTEIEVVPEIVLDPETALPGDPITVEGTGFAKEDTIIIEINSVLMTTIPALVETSALGSFSCTFNVPVGATTDDVVATDESPISAVALLTIGPTISLNPVEGPSGTVVDIAGRGFGLVADVDVEITVGVETAAEVVAIKTKADGTFSGQFIVPTLALAEYTVTATVLTQTATSDFEVTGTTAITLSPTSGAPDSEVTIEGFNFTAKADIEVTLEFGVLVLTETFETYSDGSFEGTFTVPSVIADTYWVTAEDSNGLYAEKEFRVVFTTLAVSPSKGPTGTKVLVMGGGYTDGEAFNVTMDGMLMIDGEATLEGDGSLPSPFEVYVPTLPVGEYTITLMDDEGVTGTTTFDVTKTTELILTPDQGPVNYLVSLEANYFTAYLGTDITINIYNETWTDPLITIPVTPGWTLLETNATGSYESTFLVPDLDIGDYIINATDANGLSVEATFSIVKPYIEIHTVSTNYDPGNMVSFYVNSTFDFDLTIDIEDPTGYPFTIIDCPKTGDSVWVQIGDYYVVPYADASFVLPSDAVIGSWNWTAYEASEEVDNGTFTVGEVVEPQPELPAETTGEETLDSTGSPKTSFALGETVLASAEVTNTGTESQTMLIAVQWMDPEYRTLAPIFMITTLSPGQSFVFAPGLTLPTTGYATGTWTATILVFDTWPALGGVTIGEPVTITITVS